jgi:hypothetical protein
MPMMSMPMASIPMPMASMPMPLVPLLATVGVSWHRTAQAQRRHDDVGPHPRPPDSHGYPFLCKHTRSCFLVLYPHVP